MLGTNRPGRARADEAGESEQTGSSGNGMTLFPTVPEFYPADDSDSQLIILLNISIFWIRNESIFWKFIEYFINFMSMWCSTGRKNVRQACMESWSGRIGLKLMLAFGGI
jgi:hypothetical protein